MANIEKTEGKMEENIPEIQAAIDRMQAREAKMREVEAELYERIAIHAIGMDPDILRRAQENFMAQLSEKDSLVNEWAKDQERRLIAKMEGSPDRIGGLYCRDGKYYIDINPEDRPIYERMIAEQLGYLKELKMEVNPREMADTEMIRHVRALAREKSQMAEHAPYDSNTRRSLQQEASRWDWLARLAQDDVNRRLGKENAMNENPRQMQPMDTEAEPTAAARLAAKYGIHIRDLAFFIEDNPIMAEEPREMESIDREIESTAEARARKKDRNADIMERTLALAARAEDLAGEVTYNSVMEASAEEKIKAFKAHMKAGAEMGKELLALFKA